MGKWLYISRFFAAASKTAQAAATNKAAFATESEGPGDAVSAA